MSGYKHDICLLNIRTVTDDSQVSVLNSQDRIFQTVVDETGWRICSDFVSHPEIKLKTGWIDYIEHTKYNSAIKGFLRLTVELFLLKHCKKSKWLFYTVCLYDNSFIETNEGHFQQIKIAFHFRCRLIEQAYKSTS